jgi:cell division protein ZapA (FtsZ GTPase activity inhibitor)
MSKKSVAVRIAGHDYKILSDGDPASLQQVASYVDHAMDRVRERTGTVDTLDVSVLTCLNLAREILALRQEKSEAVEDDRMRSLIERVETVLDGERSSGAVADDVAAAVTDGTGTGTGTDMVEVADSKDGSQRAPTRDSDGVDSARTLDLPSVESLRERTTAASGARGEAAAEDSMPEARVASGGRERAS